MDALMLLNKNPPRIQGGQGGPGKQSHGALFAVIKFLLFFFSGGEGGSGGIGGTGVPGGSSYSWSETVLIIVSSFLIRLRFVVLNYHSVLFIHLQRYVRGGSYEHSCTNPGGRTGHTGSKGDTGPKGDTGEQGRDGKLTILVCIPLSPSYQSTHSTIVDHDQWRRKGFSFFI